VSVAAYPSGAPTRFPVVFVKDGQQAWRIGFRLSTGVPCSYFKPAINYTIDAGDLDYVLADNEGDAVAVAGGALAGVLFLGESGTTLRVFGSVPISLGVATITLLG